MAELTTKGRKQLKKSSFALPGKRYPIHDLAHARNALARVSQYGTPEEKARVRAAVHRKYPNLAKPNSESADDVILNASVDATSLIQEALKDHPDALKALALIEGLYIDALPATLNGEMSFEAIIRSVQQACQEYSDADDTPGTQPYNHHQVIATFPDSVVYLGENGKLYQVPYAMDGTDVEIDENAEPQEVTAEFQASGGSSDMEESVALIEARPAGSIKLGRINREMGVIEGATLIGAMSSNGTNKKRRYSEAALKKIAEMAEGLPGYLNHTKPEDAFKPRDVRDIAVRHRDVRYDPTTMTVRSNMHVAPHHAATVFGLAETFGDHIGNSLVSKGAVTMEGDTEVVHDILQVRSADLVSDPASTKGLFEGTEHVDHALTIQDLIESLKTKETTVALDLAAILAHLKDHADDQKLLAEHYGWVAKADAAKLSESVTVLTTERDALKAKVVELDTAIVAKDKILNESKVELDGYKAKEAVAAKRVKLQEAIAAHPLQKEFGTVKGAISDDFKTLLEGMEEASWKKSLDDRYGALKGVPRGQAPKSDLKDLRESSGDGGIPEGTHERVAGMLARA